MTFSFDGMVTIINSQWKIENRIQPYLPPTISCVAFRNNWVYTGSAQSIDLSSHGFILLQSIPIHAGCIRKSPVPF